MAKKLSTLYPGKIDVDGNNPNGTFKNRTSDALKDGTPYEKGWASDLWGFVSHILGLAGVSPSGAEENETNSQYYDALEGLVGRRKVEFETSRDFVLNVQSIKTVQATLSRMSLLDSNFIPKFLNDLDVTWDIEVAGVLEPGTSEKASTTYGCWVDSDENVVLAPDLESVTDGTTAGKLIDSAATLLTDLVHAGDIAYNLKDLTQTTVSIDASAEGEVSVTDDIFVSGDDYKIVKQSPEGLGENRERVGSAFNNSGSDFDDSHYTQIQKEKDYNGDGTDFTVTSDGSNWVSTRCKAFIRQTNDWTEKGTWKSDLNISGDLDTTVSHTMSFTGIVFADETQAVSGYTPGSVDWFRGVTASGGNGISVVSGSTSTGWRLSVAVELNKKPTFHN